MLKVNFLAQSAKLKVQRFYTFSFYICHSAIFLILIDLESRSNMKLFTNKELLNLAKKWGDAVGAFNISDHNKKYSLKDGQE